MLGIQGHKGDWIDDLTPYFLADKVDGAKWSALSFSADVDSPKYRK